MPNGQETRQTDPTTGAQKGHKLARFDLIPHVAWDMLQESTEHTWSRTDKLFVRYWADGAYARETLIYVARFCNDALQLGGERLLAEVFGFGAQKYADRNWEKGYPWSWSYTALRRHWDAHWSGQYLDEESGLPHLAHVLWHCLVLMEFERRGLGTDDREAQL